MDEIIEFVKATLAEDDAVAQKTRRNEQFVYGTDHWFGLQNDAIVGMAPHRAVAEVKAKRELMDLADTLLTAGLDDGWDIYRALAMPHSNRPGFRAEWATGTEVSRG